MSNTLSPNSVSAALAGMSASTTLSQFAAAIPLRDLSYRYSGECWSTWKAGKAMALAAPDNPFLGGPSFLLDQGITEIDGTNGLIRIGVLTRIRMRELTDASLAKLGILDLKTTVDPGADVIHPEFVDSYKINIGNSEVFLMNNFLAASAVIDGIVSYVLPENATVGDLYEAICAALNGDKQTCRFVAAVVRGSWLGRVCSIGVEEMEKSSDFIHSQLLPPSVAAIDTYVVVPVLKHFKADLETILVR